MPKYTFECQLDGCHLRFEKNLRMGLYVSHECPRCRELAPIVVSSFAFDFAASPEAPPGNSGVTKLDYPTADQAVGRDADKRWEQYSEREKVKEKVRVQGHTRALQRHTAQDGAFVEYAPLAAPQRDARKTLAERARTVLRNTPPASGR